MLRYVSWITTTLFAALMIGCAPANSGMPAPSGQYVQVTTGFPGVVMVISPDNSSFCTGVIVSPHAVLTATHCLIEGGSYTVQGPDGAVSSSHVEIHGTGTVNDTHDVGLLIFSQAITTNSANIYPIAGNVDEGQAVTIVGYGCSNPNSRTGSGVKRMGTNVVNQKDSDFLILLTPVSTVATGIIGDSAEAGTCFGDSGGPLFVGSGNDLQVAGLTHAGGQDSSGKNFISEFVNVADNGSNHGFLHTMSAQYNLGIAGVN